MNHILPKHGNVISAAVLTAFLFHRGGHADPARLKSNAGKSFVGSYVLGMGFTFDDTDKKGVASPLAEMRRLIEDNPRNRQAIFPYIGGEEVNTSPTHAHHRYVINFRDWPLRREEAREVRAEIGESREGIGGSWEDVGEVREGGGGSRESVGELWADTGDQQRRYPLRQEDGGESESVGEVWTDAGNRWRQYPLHREDGGESEDIGESRAGVGDQRGRYPLRREDSGESEDIEGSRADADGQRRRYPLSREDGGEPEGIGEPRADAGDERRRFPLHREDSGESWADADEKRRRELRRRPIVPHDYPEPVAADWPELLAIVEERVKPERMKLGDNGDAKRRKEKYWLWGRYTPSLFTALTGLERVLAISSVGQYAAFAFTRADMVYSHALIVFPLPTHSAFCTLQSRPHELWARFFGSSLEDRLRYTPSDCFETFPFPENWEAHPALEAAGKAYYDFRATLMVRNDEGMTRTYNRFHDPDETDPDIAELRALHAAMDRAVLDAYGWRDIPTDCAFLLDYAIDEEEWGRRKKPYRYRWPDATRDEVLARLLELNAARAAEEARAGASTTGRIRPGRVAARSAPTGSDPVETVRPPFLWKARDGS